MSLRRLVPVAMALSAVAAFLVAGAVTEGESPVTGGLALSSVTGSFSITGDITAAYPSCTGSPGAPLYPGITRCITYTVTDNLNVPITVKSISTGLDSTKTQPSNCPVSNLNLTEATFSGALTAYPGTPATTTEPIGMWDGSGGAGSHTDQTLCEGGMFYFLFTGVGQYTAVTATSLTSTPNPSLAGSGVRLTAAVSTSTPGATTPTGSVTFYSCTSAACSSTTQIGAPVALSSGAASITSPVLTPMGSYYFKAAYNPSDATSWLTSAGYLTQTVNPTETISGSQGGGLTVGPGQAVVVSNSGKVGGSVTVQSGGFLYLKGGTVNGGLTVQVGGTLNVAGGTVTGGINASGAKSITICGAATVNGGVTVAGSTGPVLIGNPPGGCAGSSITGGVSVINNTGGVIVAGNNVTGGITLTGNSGPNASSVQYVEANSGSGGISCSGNVTGVTNGGQVNTVKGSRSGQCGGTF